MPDVTQISLEFDQPKGPVHGRMAEVRGASQEFDGWLGLLTVLGSLLDGPATGAEPSAAATDPA